jgi:hypothetical protein
MEELEPMSAFERYVLLAVLAHDRRDETPVQSYDVRDFCVEHLPDLAGDPFEAGVEREAVIRALSVLEAEDLLVSEVVDGSPVGKGRPAYRLAADADRLGEALTDDDLLGEVAASLA